MIESEFNDLWILSSANNRTITYQKRMWSAIMEKIGIITDSASDLRPGQYDPDLVRIIPLKIIFSDGEFKDGVTISGADWWVNVRPSNTEPLLRLNVGARGGAVMATLRGDALAVIRGGDDGE